MRAGPDGRVRDHPSPPDTGAGATTLPEVHRLQFSGELDYRVHIGRVFAVITYLPPRRLRFVRDSPLEEAVTSEPVSEAGAKFPASSELTGIFRRSGLSGA